MVCSLPLPRLFAENNFTDQQFLGSLSLQLTNAARGCADADAEVKISRTLHSGLLPRPP